MWVYNKFYSLSLRDDRQQIYLMSLLSGLDMFIHYSFLVHSLKSMTFFVVELFRLTVFFMICYYYISNASGLLPNKMLTKIAFNVSYTVIMVTFIAIGLVEMI